MRYQTSVEVNEGDNATIRFGAIAVEGVVWKLILPRTEDAT